MPGDSGERIPPRTGNEPGASGSARSRMSLLVLLDPARGGLLVASLYARGVPAVLATDARWALFWTKQILPALVIVDLRVNGARLLLSQLRHERRALISLSDDAKERGWALEFGCLDAHPRSIEPGEFGLKIATALRTRAPRPTGQVAAGELLVDLSGKRLIWRGRQITVPRLVLETAAYLAAHPGQLVPSRALLEEVWGEPWADSSRVHQAIWRLRRALDEPVDSTFFVGSRGGLGYGFFPFGAHGRAARAAPR